MSQLIFGKALIRAQLKVLETFQNGDKVLIGGGGDGEVFKSFRKSGIKIDFIEISEKMINLAKAKTDLPVRWINMDIFEYQTGPVYNYIYFPFLLDNFNRIETENLIQKAGEWLMPGGEIIITDYPEKPAGWQKVLLNLMYFFFRLVASVKEKEVPPIGEVMEDCGFVKNDEDRSFYDFLVTRGYKKIMNTV